LKEATRRGLWAVGHTPWYMDSGQWWWNCKRIVPKRHQTEAVWNWWCYVATQICKLHRSDYRWIYV